MLYFVTFCLICLFQEYLSSNKPAFVLAAEGRRKRLIELAEMREKRCDKYKQILALTNGKLYDCGDNDHPGKY